MLTRAAIAVATLVCVALAADAVAATPPQLLAARMKADMQAYYDKADRGVRITAVTCTLAASGKRASCRARFTWVKQHAVGVFTIAAKINPATGVVVPRTTAMSCKDSKTGAKLVCFR